MKLDLDQISPRVYAHMPAEAVNRALDVLENCGRTLRYTLASIPELDPASARLLLSVLPPGSRALLEAAEVIDVDDGVWLSDFGGFVVNLAHAVVEASDPEGALRDRDAAEARQWVYDRVAPASAGGANGHPQAYLQAQPSAAR
jgi:hypothetical protein